MWESAGGVRGEKGALAVSRSAGVGEHPPVWRGDDSRYPFPYLAVVAHVVASGAGFVADLDES